MYLRAASPTAAERCEPAFARRAGETRRTRLAVSRVQPTTAPDAQYALLRVPAVVAMDSTRRCSAALRSLGIYRTRVTEKGWTKLVEYLGRGSSELAQVHIGPDGDTARVMLQLLKVRPFLRVVR